MHISNVQLNIDHNISMIQYISIFIELWTEYINVYAGCTIQEKSLFGGRHPTTVIPYNR